MSVAVLSFVFERIQLLQLNRRVRTHRIGRHSVTDYGHDFFSVPAVSTAAACTARTVWI